MVAGRYFWATEKYAECTMTTMVLMNGFLAMRGSQITDESISEGFFFFVAMLWLEGDCFIADYFLSTIQSIVIDLNI